MTTNGTLFNEARAAFLGEHDIKFLLSIDGDRETHDRHRRSLDGKSSYEKIAAALPLMKRYQPWLGTRLTVHTDTVHKIFDNVLHLAGLGINHFVIGNASGLKWAEEEMDIYLEEMIRVTHWLKEQRDKGRQLRVSTLEEDFESMGKRRDIWGCRAGRHSITVTARGEIFPCSKMLGVDGLKGLFPLGTLEEGFTGIYNRLALCGMVPIPRPACRGCSLADYCMGGCYATNYQATGSIFRPDPLECAWTKRTVAMVKESWRVLGKTKINEQLSTQNQQSGNS